MRPQERTTGRAITDTLAHVLGPPQVGDYAAPIRPANAEERAREEELHTRFRRVVAPDGTVHLVDTRPGED
ncbi:hypothetical protein IGS67_12185 [Flavimobilis sp. GY10621]|uniref:Uncharacterized protein n=1 Tax=Flavimobilis rhizosphaerae TaxID=2775421 RepID=A0ABR9DSZ1_9MICO|nr:hypothetical protein [Flavimobilis rhizosphaerae]MBD9700237.1 hypothetical protein [Flavimobilis rhizosphaerae]